jgi:hypothetical protein
MTLYHQTHNANLLNNLTQQSLLVKDCGKLSIDVNTSITKDSCVINQDNYKLRLLFDNLWLSNKRVSGSFDPISYPLPYPLYNPYLSRYLLHSHYRLSLPSLISIRALSYSILSLCNDSLCPFNITLCDIKKYVSFSIEFAKRSSSSNLNNGLADDTKIIDNNPNLSPSNPLPPLSINNLDVVSLSEVNLHRKLFVNITNRVFEYHLRPRLIGFYAILCYIVFNSPTFNFSHRKVKVEYERLTYQSISKNTVEKYLNILTELELVFRDLNTSKIVIGDIDKLKHYYSLTKIEENIFCNPKRRYTRFYVDMFRLGNVDDLNYGDSGDTNINTNNNPITTNNTTFAPIPKGIIGTELYLASKGYKRHRVNKVIKEINTSKSTYYTLRQKLNKLCFIKIVRLTPYNYHLLLPVRDKLEQRYNDIKIMKFFNIQKQWNRERIERKEKERLNELQILGIKEEKEYIIKDNILHNSKYKQYQQQKLIREWYISPMGYYMKKYNINYISKFNDLDPVVCAKLIELLERQYLFTHGEKYVLSTTLVVACIINGYNGLRYSDKCHMLSKVYYT